MALKTRDKILTAATRLFNEHGFGHVTIEMLANEIGIARGNLWYHFKTKQDLIEAISAEFSEQVYTRSKIRPKDPNTVIDDFIHFLQRYAEELKQFRFLYRDQADYGEHNDRFLAEIPKLYEETRLQCLDFYKALIEAEHMDYPQHRLEDLSKNSSILFRYGLEYLRETGQAKDVGSGAVNMVIRRVLTLFIHTLKPDTAAQIQSVFE